MGGGYVFHQKMVAEVIVLLGGVREEVEEEAVNELICAGTWSCAGITPPWW